jgi:hypothetical protein
LVLTFHRTAQGYKMRCPSCGAVVRLRAEGKRRKRRAEPAPVQPQVLAPDEFDVELVSPSELADEPRPARPRRKPWGLVIAVGVVLAAVVAGTAWWLLS